MNLFCIIVSGSELILSKYLASQARKAIKIKDAKSEGWYCSRGMHSRLSELHEDTQKLMKIAGVV